MEFATWKDCGVQDIRYASDASSSEENLQWLNSLEERKVFSQCVEFLMDFHSPADETDLEGTSWEPDTDSADYQWWLARAEGGDWELVSWGY